MIHLEHAATKELDRVGIDRRLRELVRIRASQLNGCAYCIDMHTKDARALGETEQRIYALDAWRETPFFTEKERAALGLAESVTLVSSTMSRGGVRRRASGVHRGRDRGPARRIVTINAWNRISVSTRSPVPGSYQP